eukprot:g81717.t1
MQNCDVILTRIKESLEDSICGSKNLSTRDFQLAVSPDIKFVYLDAVLPDTCPAFEDYHFFLYLLSFFLYLLAILNRTPDAIATGAPRAPRCPKFLCQSRCPKLKSQMLTVGARLPIHTTRKAGGPARLSLARPGAPPSSSNPNNMGEPVPKRGRKGDENMGEPVPGHQGSRKRRRLRRVSSAAPPESDTD